MSLDGFLASYAVFMASSLLFRHHRNEHALLSTVFLFHERQFPEPSGLQFPLPPSLWPNAHMTEELGEEYEQGGLAPEGSACSLYSVSYW